jgi:hypothetical protein
MTNLEEIMSARAEEVRALHEELNKESCLQRALAIYHHN